MLHPRKPDALARESREWTLNHQPCGSTKRRRDLIGHCHERVLSHGAKWSVFSQHSLAYAAGYL